MPPKKRRSFPVDPAASARKAKAAAASGREPRSANRVKKRKSRGGLSPTNNADLLQNARARNKTDILSLSGGRGPLSSSAKVERLPETLKDIVPEGTAICDHRTVARNLEKTGCSQDNCDGKNKVFHFTFTRGSPSPTFHLVCEKCRTLLEFSTGRTTRLFKYPGSLEQTLQGRNVEGILWVLSTLCTGDNFADYKNISDSLGLHGVSASAFRDAIHYIAPFVEETLRTSISVARYCAVVHGRIDDLTSTFDAFWGTRGYHSMHGSGSINDFRLRLVLGFRNMTKCNVIDQHCGPESFSGSSGGMEPAIFRELLEELNHWLENDATELLKLVVSKFVPEHTYCILDGDSDCHKVLEEVSSGTGKLRCCNHQNKCTGAFCLKCKSRWNKQCDCPLMTTKDGSNYKNKARAHRTVPTNIAKAIQVKRVNFL